MQVQMAVLKICQTQKVWFIGPSEHVFNIASLLTSNSI